MYSLIFALALAAAAGGVGIMGLDEWDKDNTGRAKVAWFIASVLWIAAVGIVATQ